MRKKILKKTLVMSLAMAVSLSCFTGCGKGKSDSASVNDGITDMSTTATDSDATDSDAEVSVEDIISGNVPDGFQFEPTNLDDYDKIVSTINFSNLDFTLTYNNEELSYPFDIKTFESDGWTYSVDDSYMNDVAKRDNYSDSAIYINDKYPNKILTVASYQNYDTAGVTGNQDVISKYGVYNFSTDEVSLLRVGTESLSSLSSEDVFRLQEDYFSDYDFGMTKDADGAISYCFTKQYDNSSVIDVSFTFSDDVCTKFSIQGYMIDDSDMETNE